MKGRKRVDPELKVVRGTFRQDRDRARPRARASRARGEASAPSGLSSRAQELFNELVKEMSEAGTFSPTYRRAIAQLARLEERAERMRDRVGGRLVIRSAPIDEYVDEKSGKVKKQRAFVKNAALADLSQVEAHVTRLYGILGLTPESILRAPKAKDGDGSTGKKNAFEEFGATGA